MSRDYVILNRCNQDRGGRQGDPTVSARMALCVLLVAALMGCGTIATQSQTIPWPPLSHSGCPDLTGYYAGELYRYITACVSFEQPRPGRIITVPYARELVLSPTWHETASDGSSVTLIRQSPSRLIVALRNKNGQEEAKAEIRLDTPMTGCRDGALILRYERRIGSVEGNAASIEWGEEEIRRLDDGSLQFASRGAYQTFGGLTGIPGRTKWYLPTDPVPYTPSKTFLPKILGGQQK
jgi:hypothetical protein